MDDNALADLIAMTRRSLLHLRGKGVVAQCLDVMDALDLHTKSGQKPVLAHYHRTPSGWRLEWSLPAGIASRDILAKLDHFCEQTGCHIDAAVSGRILHMDVRTAAMPERVAFDWSGGEGSLPIPIGVTPAGLVSVDLSRLPHLFVAGNTGGGKTTFLRGLATAAIQDNALVTVIDLKGLDFAHLASSGHALVVDTEQDSMAVLAALNREMDRRKGILKQAGVTRLQDYRGLPWIVAIVDELAELQDKAAQDALNRLARLSRAVGICLVAATQRPSHTLFQRFTDTRMLFAGRLCFHMPKPEDSRLILDSDAAAKLPPIPGRAVWKWDREVEVQCMDCQPKDSRRLLQGVEVRSIEPSRKRLPAR